MRKALRMFDTGILVLTILLLFFIGGFTIPRIFGITPFYVKSASMEPAITTGSVVFVNRNDKDVKVGDIVTVGLSTGKDSGVYVTHRVHKIKENGLVQTKGDANDNADGFLEPSAIVGTVLFPIPKLGFVLSILEKRYTPIRITGYLLLAILVFLLNGTSLILKLALDHSEPVPAQNTCEPKIKIVRRENLTGAGSNKKI